MSLHHLGHAAQHIAHTLQHSKKPEEGAVAGAAAAGIGVPAALAMAGLALTPVGWVAALGAGAAAGAAYIAKKNKG